MLSLRSITAVISLTTVFIACGTPQKRAALGGAPVSGGLVLISIDGLRPDFYRSETFKSDAPTLRALAAAGSAARGMQAIFPTVTYPNHTTLVTGRSSAAHGVVANTILSPETGPTYEWYWNESAIKVPTLWQMAKKEGKSVAILRWPASLGAKVDWILPEVFNSPSFDFPRDWQLVAKNTDPAFLDEIQGLPDFHVPKTVQDLDRISTQAAVDLLTRKNPDLMLIHLIGVDYIQHLSGTDSPATHAGIREVDREVAAIVKAADLSRRAVVIVGDHGFKNYHATLELNALFAEKGWIRTADKRILSWDVVSEPDGGHAAIYVKKPEFLPQVRELLTEAAHGRFRILEAAELAKVHAYPDAALAVVAADGFIFSSAVDLPWEHELKTPKGHHGYPASEPEMRTGFIAVGAGIRSGVELGLVRVLDVAPTVADLLGLTTPIPDAEGRPLPLRAARADEPLPAKMPGRVVDQTGQ